MKDYPKLIEHLKEENKNTYVGIGMKSMRDDQIVPKLLVPMFGAWTVGVLSMCASEGMVLESQNFDLCAMVFFVAQLKKEHLGENI